MWMWVSAGPRRQRWRRRRGRNVAKITTGAEEAIGWKASSSFRGQRYGKGYRRPTREPEREHRSVASTGNAGQKRPASRVLMAKASAREFHQSSGPGSSTRQRPSWRSGNTHGFYITGRFSIVSGPTPSLWLWTAKAEPSTRLGTGGKCRRTPRGAEQRRGAEAQNRAVSECQSRAEQ